MKLEIKPAYTSAEQLKDLFSEYTQMLIDNDSRFAEYLKLQSYEKELENLTEKYGLPDGRLYIAYVDGEPAGCIGLHKLDETSCEMKRLYVRPAYRGKHIADKLVKQILFDAKNIGYKAMLLDTLPFLTGAIKLYKKYGFYETEAYNNSPMDNSIYMKLDL